jgi:hypothetical protein
MVLHGAATKTVAAKTKMVCEKDFSPHGCAPEKKVCDGCGYACPHSHRKEPIIVICYRFILSMSSVTGLVE